MRSLVRAVAAVAAAGVLLVTVAVVVFVIQFGVLPPTRVNLIWWIDPRDPECGETSEHNAAERVPLIGTGVSLDEMCER